MLVKCWKEMLECKLADSSGAGPREVQPRPARIADPSPGPAALHPERKSHWQISSC